MKDSIFSQITYLYGYIKEHKKILILSFILSGISTAIGMIHPIFAKIIIDKVLIANNKGLLVPILIVMIIIVIAGFIIRTANNYIYTRYSAKVLFKMREDMFYHIHKIPLTFLSKIKIGDIYHRLSSDMAEIQGFITTTIPNYLFDSLTCIITAAILFWLNWKMAIASLIFLPPASYIIIKVRPILMIIGKKTAEKNADLSHFIFESLSGTSLIRSFGAEKIELKKMEEKHDGLLKYILKYQIIGAITAAIPAIFTIINIIIVFGYGGFMVINSELTIGGLVAFSIYQGRVFTPLQGIINGLLSIQNTKVSLARIKEISDILPEHGNKKDYVSKEITLRGDIAFKNVTFSYNKKEPVLNNVTFSIPAGKTTAIIGPSGAGKTTVCHLITRLFIPDSGIITIDDLNLENIGTDSLRKQIALVSQDAFLFHTSIIENIRFSKPSAKDDEIVKAAKAACIHDFIETLPGSYDTVIGDRGIRLSGGQKQRISIARAVLIDPKILILDEATAFIDTQAEKRLKKTVQSLMENRTIIIVSHHRLSIKNADKILICKKGKIYER